MPLREQVGLLVRPGRQSLVPGAAEALVRRDAGAGSGRIGKDAVTSVASLRSAALAARMHAFPALLVSVNQEGGRLSALDWPEVVQFPGGMALGAAADADLAEQVGAAIGGQMRAAGVTWNLAPVCDLGGWPSRPAVGTRAFAADPALVAALAAAFVRGLQASGVAATAKHFPGLGAAPADPHDVVPVLDELSDGALLPFRAAVQAGVACVMAGSHVVRAVDGRPALASRRMLTLLREDLGFGGVIVTENLSIPAVHEPLGGLAQAAVAAVAAGADMVMLDSEISRGGQSRQQRGDAVRRRREVIEALAAAVEGGLISRDQAAGSVARVLRLHRRFGVGPGTPVPGWDAANATARTVADQVAARSVAVPRGTHLLPLVPEPGSALPLVRVPDKGNRKADSARYAPDLLPALLGARLPVLPLPAGASLPSGAGPAVVYGYDTRDGAGRSGAAAEAARLRQQRRPVVQVALGDPDDLAGSPADVLIAAFSPHHASVGAVSRLLADGLHARGAVPVQGATW